MVSYSLTSRLEFTISRLHVAANLLSLDSKETITSSILQVYELDEAKPGLDLRALLKQETKRKRRDFVCPTCKVDQVRSPLN